MASTRKQIDALDQATILELLANKRRRSLLKLMNESNDQSYPLNKLVSEIITKESEMGDNKRNSVRVSLRQNHIPKLVKDDVISYNQETDIVEKGENYCEVMSVIEFVEQDTKLTRGAPQDPIERDSAEESPIHRSNSNLSQNKPPDPLPMESSNNQHANRSTIELSIPISEVTKAVTKLILLVFVMYVIYVTVLT